MILSSSSRSTADPLSQVLSALGARVVRRTRLEAAGEWGLAFPALDRLKFVALLKGEQWMLLPGRPAQRMRSGDVCLIGPTPYAVASSPDATAIDGSALYADGEDTVTLGGDDVVGIGGSVVFAASDADFLLRRLPSFMLVPAGSPESDIVASVLSLLERELCRDALGAGIVGGRLADVLLIEALRSYAEQMGPGTADWLSALIDPRLGRAMRAMHADIARRWTVTSLAAEAAMSRAAFATAFTRGVGCPPLEYLRHWRLVAARAALEDGARGIEAVASAVGYTSQSAFAHAYRQHYGTTPRGAGGAAPCDRRPTVVL